MSSGSDGIEQGRASLESVDSQRVLRAGRVHFVVICVSVILWSIRAAMDGISWLLLAIAIAIVIYALVALYVVRQSRMTRLAIAKWKQAK